MPVNIQKRYELIFEEHRNADNMRLKIVQSWFLVYAALAAAFGWFQSEKQPQRQKLSWIVTGFAFVVTILFWIADRRNHDGIKAYKNVGCEIEEDPQAAIPLKQRFFAQAGQKPSWKTSWKTHTFAINTFSILMLIVLLLVTYYLWEYDGILP